jgi:two-component system chemotaxis response regulator CheB
MPPGFTESLAARLNSLGTVPCREAKPGDVVKPGVAMMAPGGKHMRVSAKGELTFDEAPPIHGVRPAADYLFQSALELYGNRLVGVVLTGMGRDGAAGARSIKDAGGVVFGESAATCTVYGMPKAAMEVGGITSEFPITEIGAAIVASLNRRLANAS